MIFCLQQNKQRVPASTASQAWVMPGMTVLAEGWTANEAILAPVSAATAPAVSDYQWRPQCNQWRKKREWKKLNISGITWTIEILFKQRYSLKCTPSNEQIKRRVIFGPKLDQKRKTRERRVIRCSFRRFTANPIVALYRQSRQKLQPSARPFPIRYMHWEMGMEKIEYLGFYLSYQDSVCAEILLRVYSIE